MKKPLFTCKRLTFLTQYLAMCRLNERMWSKAGIWRGRQSGRCGCGRCSQKRDIIQTNELSEERKQREREEENPGTEPLDMSIRNPGTGEGGQAASRDVLEPPFPYTDGSWPRCCSWPSSFPDSSVMSTQMARTVLPCSATTPNVQIYPEGPYLEVQQIYGTHPPYILNCK